jgi:hypothetical protein
VLPVPAFEMMYRFAAVVGGRSFPCHGRTPFPLTRSSPPWMTASHSLR